MEWFKAAWSNIKKHKGKFALGVGLTNFLTGEFFRVWIWPVGWAAVTVVLGFLETLPLMWIWVGATLSFAGIMGGLLFLDKWREGRRVEDKLVFLGPFIGADKTKDGKKISVAQIGIELKNNATFPISYRVEKISTIADSTVPKNPNYDSMGGVISPDMGTIFRDATIKLPRPKDKFQAVLEFELVYGLKGKEKYKMSKKCNISFRYDAEKDRFQYPWLNASKKEGG